MKRVLVIGGHGFIGRFLLPRLLEAGNDVAMLVRDSSIASLPRGVQPFQGDRRALRDHEKTLRKFKPDVVIDLILSSGTQAHALIEVFNGFAGCVVIASSMDVYRATAILHRTEGGHGETEPLPLTESSRLRTVSQTYPASQLEMLKDIFHWLDDEYDKVSVERAVSGNSTLPATILRLPMVYGVGDRLHRFWPMVKRMRDRRPHILFPQSIANWRSSRGYVENIAAAIAVAALDEHAIGDIYNVGELKCYSELEWATLIAEAVGWSGKFIVLPDEATPAHLLSPANFDQDWVVDSSRIRSELHFDEPVPREEAIRRTVHWELANPPAVEMTRFSYDAEDRAVGEYHARE